MLFGKVLINHYLTAFINLTSCLIEQYTISLELLKKPSKQKMAAALNELQ